MGRRVYVVADSKNKYPNYQKLAKLN